MKRLFLLNEPSIQILTFCCIAVFVSGFQTGNVFCKHDLRLKQNQIQSDLGVQHYTSLFQTSQHNKDMGDSDMEKILSAATSTDEQIAIISRKLFPTIFASIVLLSNSFSANAEDPIFKPNPLTNPILEKIRIMEQVEADNLSYGGELAPTGAPQGRQTYAKLLAPILKIEKNLMDVDSILSSSTKEDALKEASQILNQPQFQKKEFKRLFNAFADNIYYSDPDRANAYLMGGATPKNEQSIAYLYRNELLTNIENLQAEVTYLIKESSSGASTLDVVDLFDYISNSKKAMKNYLDLVPPPELELGRALISDASKTSL